MKFDLEHIKKEVHFIGVSVHLSDEPYSGNIRMGFRVGDPLKFTCEHGHEMQIAKIEIGFSGFQMIETSEEPLNVLNRLEVGPYYLSGGGFLKIHSSLYTLEEKDNSDKVVYAPDMEVQAFWYDFVLHSIASQFGITEPMVFAFQNAVGVKFQDDSQGFGLSFSLTKPCTEEVWKKIFTVHKLETQAAELYLQSEGGSVEGLGEVNLADVAVGRTLN